MSWLGASYAQRALAEVVLVGVLCGAVGVQVVLRRLSFFTMALTHATFPGIVLAALLGVNLSLGSGLFGVVVVLGVVALTGRPGARGTGATTAVGVLLSAGFALGVLLISAQDGFTRDLSAYLVGSILTVTWPDVTVTAATAVVTLAVLSLVGKELVFGAFDREGLAARGYPATALDLGVLLLIEAAVVTSVRAVGTILAVALIVAPAATGRLWCDRVPSMTVVAMLAGILSGVAGLSVSHYYRVATGGVIVLAATVLFLLSLLVAPHGVLRRLPRHRLFQWSL